ncbi:MAG: RagB/SusD family nutrient uptake outer membrane protein [Bacteroidia bacterium]|nr:RagB/SusD family nutrient uptake outer membrane protein [Bacteroidia bacterium]MDW8159107.1 RagB/SusD family nutrient uptake outer membrane protein [Bacteroidia bacterium]
MKRHINKFFLVTVFFLASCQAGLDDPKPVTEVDAEKAIVDQNSLESAMIGTYSTLQSGNLYGNYCVTWPDLASDLTDHTGTFGGNLQVDRHVKLADQVEFNSVWATLYIGINRANTVIEATERLTSIPEEVRLQYKGEALFLRALFYFDLCRFYSKLPYEPTNLAVPLKLNATRTIEEAAKLVPRNTAGEVYAQINKDLEEAANYLPDFQTGRASKLAAKALQARVKLYQREWAQAAALAEEVLAAKGQRERLATDYQGIFLNKNSAEAIFELQFDINNQNNLPFWYFPSTLGGRREFAPNPAFVRAWPSKDPRKGVCVDSLRPGLYYGKKYFRITTKDDNVPILRVAEMHLIRAEAKNELGELEEAKKSLNVVRARVGLEPVEVNDQAQLRLAIERERAFEFMLEGHRWYDLIRTGRAVSVLRIPPAQATFPIPQAEIDRNPRLVQNEGY